MRRLPVGGRLGRPASAAQLDARPSRGWPQLAPGLAASPIAARLASLSLFSGGLSHLEHLAQLPRLTRLKLTGVLAQRSSMRLPPSLKSLELVARIEVRGIGGPAWLRALGACTALESLRLWRLTGRDFCLGPASNEGGMWSFCDVLGQVCGGVDTRVCRNAVLCIPPCRLCGQWCGPWQRKLSICKLKPYTFDFNALAYGSGFPDAVTACCRHRVTGTHPGGVRAPLTTARRALHRARHGRRRAARTPHSSPPCRSCSALFTSRSDGSVTRRRRRRSAAAGRTGRQASPASACCLACRACGGWRCTRTRIAPHACCHGSRARCGTWPRRPPRPWRSSPSSCEAPPPTRSQRPP